MTRLAAILAACAMVVVLALAVSWGVDNLLPSMLSHPFPRWLPGMIGSISGIVLGGIMIWRNRNPPQEDERLTPVVRRDPKTGLRQL